MPRVPVDLDQEQGRRRTEITEEATAPEVHERGVSQVLVAKDQGRDPAMAYIEATRSNDKQAMLNNWVESTKTDRMALIESELGYKEDLDVPAELGEMEADLEGDVSQGNYRQTIKSLPMSVDKTEDEVTREAVYMQYRENMANQSPDLNEMDLSGIAANVVGSAVPKRKAYAVANLMDDMGFGNGLLGSAKTFIDPTTDIMKMRNMFWSLDDSGKAEFLNVYAQHIDNATDNDFIKAEITENIFGADFAPGTDRAFELLDTVDIIGLSAGAVKLVNSMRKAGKIINVPRRLKEPDVEAAMIEDAVKNPEGARQVDITPADVGDHLNPLINGELGNVLIGASEDQAAAVVRMMEVQDARFAAIYDEMGRQSVLDGDELNRAMKQAEDAILDDPNVIDAAVEQVDDAGFKLKYTEAYFDKAGRVRQRSHEKVVDFTVDDIGELKVPDSEWRDKWLAMDPNTRMQGKLREWFVSSVERLGRQQEQTSHALDKMMRDAFKGLKSDSAAKVDHALRRGSKHKRTYTYAELRAGETGIQLSDKEARAYIGARNVVEKLYRLKNQQLVDQYITNGVKLWDGPEGVLPIKQYADNRAAATAWKQVDADSNHILIPERGLTLGGQTFEGGLMNLSRKRDLTQSMIDEAYRKGYVLARNNNQQSFFRLGEVKTQWAFVKAKHVVSPRGQQVLHRIEGYMPKQRTDNFWFIKRSKPSGLSGAQGHRVLSTDAYSDSREAAEAWVKKQDNPDDYEIVFDRELTSEQRAYDISSTHGGMYAGSRKTTELQYVGQADPKFANSFEALQHYINHIGRQYPAALYRMGAEHRLIKIANDLGIRAKNLSMHNVLDEARQKFTDTSKQYKMLKDIHDQISFVNMIPTDEERAMSHLVRKGGQFLDNGLLNKIPGWNKVPKWFYQKAAQNAQPVNVIRGLTFNHLLGMYNPAQVIVQFSGSLVSMAIDPVGYPKHVARMLGWGTLDQMVSDPMTQKKMIDWFRSKGLNDYADTYELWRKSGYLESVTQGNADYVSVFTRNMPYDENVLRKVTANHTLFYKMGELANTRVAFSTAVDRYKKVHKVKSIDPNDQAALDEISNWAEKYRLNMGRANQSDLNKGWLGAPLQFQQVISKYFEKLLPQVVGGTDEFTAFEKMRLAMVPTFMTGAVGIPFGKDFVIGFMEMLGIDETELTEEQAQSLKYGAIGRLTGGFGLNVNFSDRMTLGGDVIRNIWEGIATMRPTWQMMGASGTVADRYARNIQYMSEALSILPPEDEEDVATVDEIVAWASVLSEVATDIPTVSRNWKQYAGHFIGNNRYVKDGKYMWEWETMNKATAVGAALGFQPTEMTEMYELADELRDSDASYAVFGETDADIIIRLMNTKLLTGGNVKTSKFYSRLINNMLHKYGLIEQQKLLGQIWNKMNSKQMDQNNLMWKALMEEMAREQKGLDLLNTLYNRKIQERP